jgi:hypothetical protein
LAKILITMLHESNESGHSYLFFKLWGMSSIFLIQYKLEHRFSMEAFIMLKSESSNFFGDFVMKRCWILSKFFLKLLRWLTDVYLHSIYVLCYEYGFECVKLYLYPCSEINVIIFKC